MLKNVSTYEELEAKLLATFCKEFGECNLNSTILWDLGIDVQDLLEFLLRCDKAFYNCHIEKLRDLMDVKMGLVSIKDVCEFLKNELGLR